MSELGKRCGHGLLARQCYICELEAERDQILALLATERDAFGKRETELMAERNRLIEHHYDLTKSVQERNEEIERLKGTNTAWAKAFQEMTQNRDAWKAKADEFANSLAVAKLEIVGLMGGIEQFKAEAEKLEADLKGAWLAKHSIDEDRDFWKKKAEKCLKTWRKACGK